MKAIKVMAAQGDALFRRVDSIPAHAIERPRNGELVVAHSETGHHHVIRSPDAVLLETGNPFLCYLRIDSSSVDVEHLRPFDTHETLRLLGRDDGPTFYEVRRQREHALQPAPVERVTSWAENLPEDVAEYWLVVD